MLYPPEREALARMIQRKINQPITDLRLIGGRWRATTSKWGVPYKAWVTDLLRQA